MKSTHPRRLTISRLSRSLTAPAAILLAVGGIVVVSNAEIVQFQDEFAGGLESMTVIGSIQDRPNDAADITDRVERRADRRENGFDNEDVGDAPATDANEPSSLTVTAGVGFSHAYYFRGYLQENDGLISQPSIAVGFPVWTNEAETLTIGAEVGQWNSFHSAQTGAASGPGTWYESDFWGALTAEFGNATVYGMYTFYTSPSGAFETIQELTVGGSYGFAFGGDENPIGLTVGTLVAMETVDGPGSTDVYWEVNAELSKDFTVGERTITMAVPVALGFSLDDYYVDANADNEFFGYASVGLMGSMPINFQNGRYGDWTIQAGVQGLFLTADSLEAINDGESTEVVGTIGLGIDF